MKRFPAFILLGLVVLSLLGIALYFQRRTGIQEVPLIVGEEVLREPKIEIQEEQLFVERDTIRLRMMASNLRASGKHEQAIAKFQKILSTVVLSEEERKRVYFALAESYHMIGRYDKAMEYYQRVAKSENKYIRELSLSRIANLFLGQDHIEKAIQTLGKIVEDEEQEKLIRMATVDHIIHIMQSEIETYLPKEELKKIIDRFGIGEITLPARARLAEVYASEGKYDEAERIAREIIKNYPDDFWALSAKITLFWVYAGRDGLRGMISATHSLLLPLLFREDRVTPDDAQVEELLRALEAVEQEIKQESN